MRSIAGRMDTDERATVGWIINHPLRWSTRSHGGGERGAWSGERDVCHGKDYDYDYD